MDSQHHWGPRLAIGMIMLMLAFLGVILAHFSSTGGWEYWRVIVAVFALLALWLSWYLRRSKQKPISLWYELLQWVGLFATVFLVSIFVHSGILTPNQGSLFVLTLLSLTVFIAGIYIERTFLLIGTVLGIFATLLAFAVKYLLPLIGIILIAAAGIIAYMIWRSDKTTPPINKN